MTRINFSKLCREETLKLQAEKRDLEGVCVCSLICQPHFSVTYQPSQSSSETCLLKNSSKNYNKSDSTISLAFIQTSVLYPQTPHSMQPPDVWCWNQNTTNTLVSVSKPLWLDLRKKRSCLQTEVEILLRISWCKICKLNGLSKICILSFRWFWLSENGTSITFRLSKLRISVNFGCNNHNNASLTCALPSLSS